MGNHTGLYTSQLYTEDSRAYSGFPGCKRNDGASVTAILNTLSSMVLVLQMVFNIANSNNNGNKKNENNQNNNNNNNVETFDNIFVSMNENESMAMMMMMLGRHLNQPDSYLSIAANYTMHLILHAIINTPTSSGNISVAALYKDELLRLFQMK